MHSLNVARLVFLLVLSSPLGVATAQQSSPLPRVPTITVNSRLVVLDVVVTGKDGVPVHGLTRDDFPSMLYLQRRWTPPQSSIQ
jgi:hypothetical protein